MVVRLTVTQQYRVQVRPLPSPRQAQTAPRWVATVEWDSWAAQGRQLPNFVYILNINRTKIYSYYT